MLLAVRDVNATRLGPAGGDCRQEVRLLNVCPELLVSRRDCEHYPRLLQLAMSNDAFGAMAKGWEAFLRGYARLLGPEQYESNYNRKRINNRIYLAKRANSIEIFFLQNHNRMLY